MVFFKYTGCTVIYTRQDGTSGSSFEVTANTIRFLTPKSEGGGVPGGEEAPEAGGDAGDIPF